MSDISLNENEQEQPGLPNSADDDLLKEITNNLKKGRSHWTDWRNEAKEAYDFFAGVQWDEEDASKLEEQGRPAVVFNRIVRTINAVAGVEVQNRQEVKYYPRNINVNQGGNPQDPTQSQDPNAPNSEQGSQDDDSGYSEMLNHAASWVRDQTNAEDEESEAFQDNLICGMGWTETRMEYDENPEGMIRKDRIDPISMLVDPDSKKRNFEDAKWVACVKDFSKNEVREMFPGITDFGNGDFWADQDMLVHDDTMEAFYRNNYGDQLTDVGKVSVVQYQYWRKVPTYLVLTRDGNLVTFTKEKYDQAKMVIDKLSQRVVRVEKKVFKQCFIVGNQIADQTDLGCDHFTFRGMTGLRDRNRNYWFGLVAIMKDPQRWANKWLSQIQYILNSNSKGGLMYEEGAVSDIRKLEDQWASPDGIIKLNAGGLEKIMPKPSTPYPDGIDRLLNYAVSAINDIPGVNLELMGMAARDQPIGLEMTRKDAGITVLATFFDSLRRYRKMDGRILAYFIREYIADNRLIRVLGENGIKYIPLMKNKVAFDYDIVVDDAPTSTNSKERTFMMLNQILPMAIQAGIPVPKEILDYAPLPQDLIQKWKSDIADAQAPDPKQEAIKDELTQINMMLAQISVQQAQQDVAKTQSETMKNYATAEKDKAVGSEQMALSMQKFGVINGEQDLKAQAMQQDQQRKDLVALLNERRKMLEVQLTNELNHKKVNHDQRLSLLKIQ